MAERRRQYSRFACLLKEGQSQDRHDIEGHGAHAMEASRQTSGQVFLVVDKPAMAYAQTACFAFES